MAHAQKTEYKPILHYDVFISSLLSIAVSVVCRCGSYPSSRFRSTDAVRNMKPSNPSKLHLGWASILLQILFAQFCCTELELRVVFITTYSGQYVSNGSLPAVVLAVDEVNEVLAGRYRLHLNTSTITVSAMHNI